MVPWIPGRPGASSVAPALLALALASVLLSGCGQSVSGPPAGAPVTASGPTGPTALITPTIAPLAPRVLISGATSSAHAAATEGLAEKITAALVTPGGVAPAVKITQKAAAGNQVLVSWTVSLDPADAGARLRARTQSIKVLTMVKASGLPYGSVLLAITGATLEQGKKKISIVVRAKYTQALVRAKNWATVTPDMIFKLPDDKPAVIATAFR